MTAHEISSTVHPKVELSAAAALLFFMLPVAALATSGTLVITVNSALTEEHFGDIVIGADNVYLDCRGNYVTGDGSGSGILLEDRTGTNVRRCVVRNFEWGFHLDRSRSNTLTENTALLNHRGFFVENEHPTLGTKLRDVSSPFVFNGQRPQFDRPAPALGESNEDVYRGLLGMSGDDLTSLREQGVV